MFDFRARTIVPVLCAAIAFFAVACGGLEEEEEETPKASTSTITIKGFKFSPNELTVKEGTKVTWENKDNDQHAVTCDTGEFDQLLMGGESWSYTFTKKGTFTYKDRIHEQPGLVGKVIVE